MKTKPLIILTVASIVIYMSCSKGNSNKSKTSATPATFTFKVGDSVYSWNGDIPAGFVGSEITRATPGPTGFESDIFARGETGDNILMYVFTPDGKLTPGTYTSSPGQNFSLELDLKGTKWFSDSSAPTPTLIIT